MAKYENNETVSKGNIEKSYTEVIKQFNVKKNALNSLKDYWVNIVIREEEDAKNMLKNSVKENYLIKYWKEKEEVEEDEQEPRIKEESEKCLNELRQRKHQNQTKYQQKFCLLCPELWKSQDTKHHLHASKILIKIIYHRI